MKSRFPLIMLASFLAMTTTVQARYVSFVLAGGKALATNEIQVATNEVISFRGVAPTAYQDGIAIRVIKDGKSVYLSGQDNPIAIAGPAILQTTFNSPDLTNVVCTYLIQPDVFLYTPDKTIIIPAGAAGATVALESSTNLLNWTTATNGFYSNTDFNMFFRIRADRAP